MLSLQDGSRARPEGWAGRGGVERAGCTAGGGKEEEPGGTLGRQGTELSSEWESWPNQLFRAGCQAAGLGSYEGAGKEGQGRGGRQEGQMLKKGWGSDQGRRQSG